MNWETIRSYLNQGWVGIVIGAAIAIVTLIVSMVVSYRLRHRVEMSYQWWLVRLIGGDSSALPDDVKISFKDVPVPRLSSSTVVIWNTGNTTIRGQDIVASDHLRLLTDPNGQLLEVKIPAATRDVIAFKANINSSYRNVISLDFDFLDPDDGAVVEVLHTGDPSMLGVSGTIRGMPQGLKNRGKLPRSRRVLDFFPFYWIAVWLPTILFQIFLLYRQFFPSTIPPSSSGKVSIFFYLIPTALVLLGPLTMFLDRRRRIPKRLADSVGLERWYY